MDLNQLDVVLAVAKHKSFSEAAITLGMTRTGVGMAVANVEKAIDVTIFTRTDFKASELTEKGELVVEQLKKVRAELYTLYSISNQ